MRRRELATLLVAAALTLDATRLSAAQSQMPLLDDPANCIALQEPFDGPQPAVSGETVTVRLATDCYLVVGLDAPAGEPIDLTYLSGQFDAIDVAFYESTSEPGNSFHNPSNALLGVPTTAADVPGASGVQQVLVVLQGVGGPSPGTAAIRVSAGVPPPTVTTEQATTSTSASSTTDAPTTSATVEPSTTTTTTTSATTSGQATSTEARASSSTTGAAAGALADDGSVPDWWWIPLAAIAAALAVAMLVRLLRPRGAAPSPFHRHVVAWTLQHAPPSGTCSSNARAIVDRDDSGSLDGYEVSTLFVLPVTGKRVRTTVGDPMLGQVETLYLGGGSGPELRSAVDALVNALCRHLDQKKVPADGTVLTEMTKSDVDLTGEAYACVNGSWKRFSNWRDVPGLPDGEIQNDLVQVAVLGSNPLAAVQWIDRTEELATSITALIEARRAPAGLWVFD